MTLPALKRIAKLRELFLADDFDTLMALADDPTVVARFAAELKALDRALTDKVHTHGGAYEREARKILEGRTVVLHLADGGYSRLAVGFAERAEPWMDEGVSRPKAIARWRAMKGQGQRGKAQSLLASVKRKQEEAQALRRELEQIAALAALGITRHDIVKQRRQTRYSQGRRYPTDKADIIMRDGTAHVVPANLLKWR